MSTDNQNFHTTLVRSNDRFVSAAINLGDLITIHPYASRWPETLYMVRFRHGSVDMSETSLDELVAKAQAARALSRKWQAAR
ncbi:hypothetical protein [Mycobacterium sp. TY813]|uniref:hypothetical protein n=1 Tax=Mycobacterium TaxID=1763 RepID=UPI0027425E28|nr:hypothetical protein [Mycobacterium sp. TY813]MDP7729541.1 hypothetical protein [Mycobacterium sp. TY813]